MHFIYLLLYFNTKIRMAENSFPVSSRHTSICSICFCQLPSIALKSWPHFFLLLQVKEDGSYLNEILKNRNKQQLWSTSFLFFQILFHSFNIGFMYFSPPVSNLFFKHLLNIIVFFSPYLVSFRLRRKPCITEQQQQ